MTKNGRYYPPALWTDTWKTTTGSIMNVIRLIIIMIKCSPELTRPNNNKKPTHHHPCCLSEAQSEKNLKGALGNEA